MWKGGLVGGGGIGLGGGEVGFHWKESHRQELAGTDPIGRVAADREAGADYSGHTEGGGRGNELVTVSPEAWAIIWMKSVDEVIE